MRTRTLIVTTGLTSVVAASWLGCRPSHPSPQKTIAADQILTNMVSAYRVAQSYADRGVIRLAYTSGGHTLRDSAPFSVRYKQPGRLRLRAYQILLASNGQRMRARFMDESSGDLATQLVDLPMENELTISKMQSDEFLWTHLEGGVGGIPLPLRLLTEDNVLSELFEPDVTIELVKQANVSDRLCHVVQIGHAGNEAVFWIDTESYELRRIEYPTVEELSVVADFDDATFDASLGDDDFMVSAPDNAQQVRYFVVPPQPLPTNLFGQTVGNFKLFGSGGNIVSSASLSGHTAVLIWFNNHPSCRQALIQLEQVYSQYQNNDRINFFAVWAEGANIGDKQLRGLLAEWKVNIPVVRDMEACGNDLFHIPVTPALIILDDSGRVQIFEIGVNETWTNQLPHILDRLLKGVDVAEEILQQHDRELIQYQRNLAIAAAKGEQTTIELPQIEVGDRTDSQHWKLSLLWRCSELKVPGNIYLLGDDGGPSLLVHDGVHEVVGIDRKGNIVDRHVLDIPSDITVTFLRTAIDGSGHRFFAGGDNLTRCAFVFDKDWRLVLRYPMGDQKHEGIQDLRLVDLNDDGKLELVVGFWGLAGVHAVDLDGKRIWGNRAAHSILSLTASPPDDSGARKLFVTSNRGRILPINADGRDDSAIQVGTWSVYYLAAAKRARADHAMYCGLAYTSDDKHVAFGIDSKWNRRWSYTLPQGMHSNPIQPVTSANLFADDLTFWLFSGPDGSIHVVSDNGEFRDQFRYGKTLRGLAATRWDDTSVLLVSTESEVTAWRIEMREN